MVRGGGGDAARSPTGLPQLERKRSVSIAENNMRLYAAVRALRNDAPLKQTQAELLRESTRSVAVHGLELVRSLITWGSASRTFTKLYFHESTVYFHESTLYFHEITRPLGSAWRLVFFYYLYFHESVLS